MQDRKMNSSENDGLFKIISELYNALLYSSDVYQVKARFFDT